MNAIELMVGDLLRVNKDVCLKKGTIVEVRGIDADNAFIEKGLKGCATCVNINDHCEFGGVWIDFLEPIPLTPEILEKNGFDKRNDGCVWNDENGSTVVVLWKEYNYTHCYNYIDASIGCITVRELPITYVHELQHFFRLCGINKKISL